MPWGSKVNQNSLLQNYRSQLNHWKSEIDELFLTMFQISYYHEVQYYKDQFKIILKKILYLESKISHQCTKDGNFKVEFDLLSLEVSYIKKRLKTFDNSFSKAEEIIKISKVLK